MKIKLLRFCRLAWHLKTHQPEQITRLQVLLCFICLMTKALKLTCLQGLSICLSGAHTQPKSAFQFASLSQDTSLELCHCWSNTLVKW